MNAMRIGSLFSGAGGLDLAVEQVFGGRTVWHSELEFIEDKEGCRRPNAAVKVLAHHWPGVPNLGDISAVDWATVEPIDILCGGFPCQDISAAGKRAGMGAGTRSGLWSEFARAIDELRPRAVVIENVRNLLSVEANRAMESADSTLGDGPGRPILRALGAVLGDLSDLGYDAQWATVSASSVGAPHKRERVFILATAVDAHHATEHRQWACKESGWRDQGSTAHVESQPGGVGDGDQLRAGRSTERCEQAAGRGTTADAEGECRADIEGCGDPAGQQVVTELGAGGRDRRGPATEGVRELRGSAGELAPIDLLPTPAAARSGRNRSASDGAAIRPSLDSITALLPTPRARDHKGCDPNPRGVDLIPSGIWGKYGPAIHRWESLTRPAPSPTEPNTKGNPRLAAAFPEWMQGLAAGWVTAVSGISRNDMLRIIGNSVCPQQAVAALAWLIEIRRVAA